MERPIRVAIVDDHPVLAESLAAVLSRDKRFEVTMLAGSGSEVIAAYDPAHIDVCIVDVALGEMSGTEVVRVLKERHLGLRALMLSAHAERYLIKEAFEAGAIGYLVKSTPLAQLKDAIVSVAAGERVLSAGVYQDPAQAEVPLTERQREILELLAVGLNRQGIADRLHVSLNTVKTHLSVIYEMLGVDNAREARLKARELGLVRTVSELPPSGLERPA